MAEPVDPLLGSLGYNSDRRPQTTEGNRIAVELTFDVPQDLERQIDELHFEKVDADRLRKLAGKSAALKKKLAADPAVAREFAADPVAVMAREFPELEIPVRKDRRILDERFRVQLEPIPAAPDVALEVLRRALVFVAASPANSDAFEADPLNTLRAVNSDQPEADVARAELALEQVLGIYRLQRIPLELYLGAARYATSRRPR